MRARTDLYWTLGDICIAAGLSLLAASAGSILAVLYATWIDVFPVVILRGPLG